jgi:hypothetical protein
MPSMSSWTAAAKFIIWFVRPSLVQGQQAVDLLLGQRAAVGAQAELRDEVAGAGGLVTVQGASIGMRAGGRGGRAPRRRR